MFNHLSITMMESVSHSQSFKLPRAKQALDISVKGWFGFALIGQWAFAIYIFFVYAATYFYGLDVTEFSPAPNLKKGDDTIRLMFFAHTIPAIYLSLFGVFQLVPSLRNRFKTFHRWNGRTFLILGFTGAFTGLFMQWSKGADTNTAASLGITLNGLLILIATCCAGYYAVKMRIELHKRWAIHAFFLVNGVWTFRLYLMGWYIVNQGPNGNTPNIDGPMDIFLSFACYLIPMLFAELYLWARKQQSNKSLWFSTAAMSVGALVTLIGVGATIMMMWSPRINSVINAI